MDALKSFFSKHPSCLYTKNAIFTDMTQQNYNSIRVIAIFAHPDDAEVKMGGTAAKFAEKGHADKFVSLTNGDVGHTTDRGAPHARRRALEAQEAAKRLGIDEYKVFRSEE